MKQENEEKIIRLLEEIKKEIQNLSRKMDELSFEKKKFEYNPDTNFFEKYPYGKDYIID